MGYSPQGCKKSDMTATNTFKHFESSGVHLGGDGGNFKKFKGKKWKSGTKFMKKCKAIIITEGGREYSAKTNQEKGSQVPNNPTSTLGKG